MLAIVVVTSLVILFAALTLVRVMGISHSPNADMLIKTYEACLWCNTQTKKP
ncbi:hypothetical protein SYK_22650 [Pseudodesulfovibrio nedwellii]|uniref:Uncharacterized protein n=1 Tax=Pseudodesulfovibrio nedwellii TaxID=2973072 RepID=A0ABM8B2A0_9BACT|nr:hypothetical protein SYK_22650 [Pseudodesulfovibrio nedwellii]